MNKYRLLLYPLLGLISAIPLIFGEIWILSWLAPVLLFFLELTNKKNSYFRAYFRGLLYFFFYGVLTFSWFYKMYPLDYLGFSDSESATVVMLGIVGIPLMQGVISAFIFVFFRFLIKRNFSLYHPVLTSLFVGVLFAINEFIQTKTVLSAPWGKYAVSQVYALPVIQSVSLFGSYFTAFLIVFFGIMCAYALYEAKEGRSSRGVICFALAVIMFSSNIFYGAVRLEATEEGESLKVAALQGNILFSDKWSGKENYTMETYKALTLEADASGAELIVMPETALPYDINEKKEFSDFFAELNEKTKGEILGSVFVMENGNCYNTVFPVSDSPMEEKYCKTHLVPFGEYFPMESLVEKLCPALLKIARLDVPITSGSEACVFDMKCGKVSSLICYDSCYEDVAMDEIRGGSELLCISTNDSWFSESAAMKEHLKQSQIRAVECGRYVVRSANTGISAVITDKGVIKSSLGEGKMGVLCDTVRLIDTRTPYSIIGNSFIYAGAAYSLGILIYCLVRKKYGYNRKL